MAPTGTELLVGVTRDPTGLLALTLGAGGTEAELHREATTLVLPASREAILEGLQVLPRIWALLQGYRGKRVVCGHTATECLPPELSSFTPEDPPDMWVGDSVVVHVVTNGGHFDVIAPGRPAWPGVLGMLRTAFGLPASR